MFQGRSDKGQHALMYNVIHNVCCRHVLIEVLDANGLSAQPVAVTLTYVGQNVNAPVIIITRKPVGRRVKLNN